MADTRCVYVVCGCEGREREGGRDRGWGKGKESQNDYIS